MKLNENASSGATSSGAIAIDMSGTSRDKNKKYSLKSFMDSWQKKVKNTFKPYTINITEDFDLESVFSRLSGMERRNLEKNQSTGTTFGIEDDNGNLMKVTVDRSQADAFETEVANYLADIKKTANNFPAPEKERSVSMAELLYKLKGQFNIIDVEFPEIPKDVVYNIKDASSASDVDMQDEDDFVDDDFEAEDNDTESDDFSEPLDLTDYEETNDKDTTIDDIDNKDEDELDISNEFPEPQADSEESILSKVINMLKSQAESEIERAKADAEKAKAEQARYTAQATQTALRDQEEKLRYEVEMEAEKKKEKEARMLADMAKRKISQTLSTVSEADEGATPATVMRQRQQIALQFKIEPDDSPETRQYKAKQKNEAMREWTAKYRQALNADRYQKQLKQKERSDKIENDKQQNELNKERNDNEF